MTSWLVVATATTTATIIMRRKKCRLVTSQPLFKEINYPFFVSKQMEPIEDFYCQKCFGTDWNFAKRCWLVNIISRKKKWVTLGIHKRASVESRKKEIKWSWKEWKWKTDTQVTTPLSQRKRKGEGKEERGGREGKWKVLNREKATRIYEGS